MRTRATLVLFVALASLAAASAPLQAHAAARRPMPSWDGRVVLRLHGGASFPMGNFGSAYQTGFGGGGSIGYGVSENVLGSWGIAYHHFVNQPLTTRGPNITPYAIGVRHKHH